VVTKKSPPSHLHQTAAEQHDANAIHHTAVAADATQDDITDCAYTEQAEPTTSPQKGTLEAGKYSGLVARGKDLLSGDVSGVVTAGAIVVGAALIEVELIPGLIIGAGAILFGKLFPELGSYVRPVIKSVVRAGFSASQKAREVMAEASEQVHDLVAEVKHEQAQAQELPAKQMSAASKTDMAQDPQPAH
jgi:hypothetical protein